MPGRSLVKYGTQRRKPLSFAFNEFDKLLSLTY